MGISLFVPRSPQGMAMTSWDGWWSRLTWQDTGADKVFSALVMVVMG